MKEHLADFDHCVRSRDFEPQESFPKPKAASRKTILLVDSDPSQVNFLFELLSRCGHRVIKSETPQDAINVLSHKHIDLVVSRDSLQGLSGTELAHYVASVKTFPRSSLIPVILIGSFGEESEELSRGSTSKLICPQENARRLLRKLVRSLLNPDSHH